MMAAEEISQSGVVFSADNYLREQANYLDGDGRDTGWDTVNIFETSSGLTVVRSEHHMTLNDRPDHPEPSPDKQLEATIRVNDWHVIDRFRESRFGRSMLNLFGISVSATQQGGSIYREHRVPPNSALVQTLNLIKEKTGYAPDVAEFDGKMYAASESLEAYTEKRRLIASSPSLRTHDAVVHLLLDTALTGPATEMVAKDTQERLDDPSFANDEEARKVRSHVLDIVLSTAVCGEMIARAIDDKNPEQIQKLFMARFNVTEDTARMVGEGILARAYSLMDVSLAA
jgi:hypothetical protein